MTIGEVSKEYNLSQDTLRYYEKIGLIFNVKRNKSGIRDYSEENIKQIEFIKCMRGANLPIEALIRYTKLYSEGDSRLEERKEILVEQRNHIIKQIEELNKAKERLDYKIKIHDEKIEKNKKLK